MFWSAPKKKKDDDKERQVKELKQVFPSIRRPNNDDNLFEIKFVVNNQYSSLRVFIPTDFPNIRPVLQASGPILHPWLDQLKQVNGSDKLMQWTRNSSLVEVVEESLSALLAGYNEGETAKPTTQPPSSSYGQNVGAYQPPVTNLTAQAMPARPPTMPETSAYPSYGAQAQYTSPPTQQYATPAQYSLASASYDNGYPATATATATAAPSNPRPSITPATQPTPLPPAQSLGARGTSGAIMPSLPSSFPELEQLTTVQLQRLLNDEVALEAHLSEVESIKQMQTVVQQMKQGNEENARRNLRQEAELVAAVEEAEGQQSALKVLVHEYREKLDAMKRKCETPLDSVLKELRATKDGMDASTEDLGAAFVEGKMELGKFITDFLEQRAKYHELATKLKIMGK